VRRGLWHHLTIADEDRAISALKRERERNIGGPTRAVGNSGAAQSGAGEGMMKLVLDLAMRRIATTAESCAGAGKQPTSAKR
jgi:hypothetical protein